jgi:hypothetical protein
MQYSGAPYLFVYSSNQSMASPLLVQHNVLTSPCYSLVPSLHAQLYNCAPSSSPPCPCNFTLAPPLYA